MTDEQHDTTAHVDDVPDPSPTQDAPTSDAATPDAPTPDAEVDLDAIERDLHAVETALNRLADGTYWTDEVTGAPIPEHVLISDPTARRS